MNPLISIIVPVYNAEKYIAHCIDSILSQTFANFEALLVNDGSTDESGKICDDYAKKNDRVRVIHKENGGVSSARNKGLDNATGNWICFIDSDDWVSTSYLQNFINAADEDTQLVLQSFWHENETKQTSIPVYLPDCIINYNFELVSFLESAKNVHNGFLWHRMFKRAIIEKEKVRFAVGVSFAEDGWFFYQYLKTVQHFVLTSAIGYHYCFRQGSLTSSGNKRPIDISLKVIRGFIDSLSAFDMPEAKREQHTYFIRRYTWRLIESWFVNRAYQDTGNKKQCLNIVRQLISEYRLDDIIHVSFSLKLLIKALTWKDSVLKDLTIRNLLLYRKYKQKINAVIARIRKR